MFISDLLRRMPAVEDKLPRIGLPVSPTVTSFEDGKVMLCMRLAGMPFESINDAVIQNEFDTLNRILAARAMDKGNRLAIWTTFSRRRARFDQACVFRNAFMQRFADKYMARFRDGKYFDNAFYISFVLRVEDLEEGTAEMEDLGSAMVTALQTYDPEILVTEERNGILFSQPYAFIGELINGVDEPIPVTTAAGRSLIPSAHLHFGYDVLEIRTGGATKFATCYDLKDFPECSWGQLNALLALPAEFTITQSFSCLGTYESKKAIDAQINKLTSVGDGATKQLAQLNQAQGEISGRELAFGDYHGALVVYGDTAQDARDNGELVSARSLNLCGVRWIKASLSAPVSYWSQVPGYARKPRPMMKSTRNLAATFSMHNYSSGKARGNPLGDGSAVMPVHTVAEGLYHLNLHASREKEDNLGEKVAGHSTFIGATGVGKTTIQLAVIGFLSRFNTKIFALDVDRGMEIFIRHMGGEYFAIKAGEPTRLAPFGLPDTPRNREFLYDLVGACGRDQDGKLTADEEAQIKTAVDTVYRIENVGERRFSRILESIPNMGIDCLAARLAKWCYATDGRFAWALDNAPSEMHDIRVDVIGFDVTDFLKPGYEPSEPILAYLLHLKDLMQEKGGLLATIMEEFWLPAQFPTTQKMMFKVLKTGRKADEFLILVSQSPEDAINSPIWPAIRDQCATKVYLANPDAEYETYKRCNLTEKEFAELKKLSKQSRTFLVKQGNQSVFAKLDLYGFWDEIAVLSGSTENVAIWEEIWNEHSPNLELCTKLFQERRKGKRDPGEAAAAA